MTLNGLMAVILRYFSEIGSFRAHCVKVVEDTWWPKKFGTIILYALTLPNINRFSKLFQYKNQEKIYNNTVAEDPTTPQV